MINLLGQLTTAPLPLVQQTRPFHCIDGDYDAAAADNYYDNDMTKNDFYSLAKIVSVEHNKQ